MPIGPSFTPSKRPKNHSVKRLAEKPPRLPSSRKASLIHRKNRDLQKDPKPRLRNRPNCPQIFGAFRPALSPHYDWLRVLTSFTASTANLSRDSQFFRSNPIQCTRGIPRAPVEGGPQSFFPVVLPRTCRFASPIGPAGHSNFSQAKVVPVEHPVFRPLRKPTGRLPSRSPLRAPAKPRALHLQKNQIPPELLRQPFLKRTPRLDNEATPGFSDPLVL